jgi:serine/threonine-protein kinase
VRVSDGRLRITAQLINAVTGFHLWAQTYDRDSRDLLSLEQEIATAVAGALKIKLLADDKSELMPGGTRNADAYDAYLRGRYGETVEDEANLRAALAAQEEALTLDPEYADALAARADVAAQIGNMFTPDAHAREQLYAKAVESAEKAVALAPRSGWAYSILGQTLANVKGDFKAADAAYRKSVELEPGNADILHAYASFAASFGRADAINMARRAVQLDPLGLGSWGNLALTLFYAHRFDEAAAAFSESARLGYNHVNASWSGLNELAAGRPDSARKACEMDTEFWYNQLCLALVYHKLGRQKDAQAMLDKIRDSQGDALGIEYAEIHAYWGNPAAALQALQHAVQINDPGLLSIRTDPFLDSLHDDPEFKAIVAKLDLPT